MGIKERKERDREKQRDLILQAAGEIFAKEGLEKLSIRKIADKIEYSPAIVYHYFKDKEDIVSHIMKKGYLKLISSLSSVDAPPDQPEQRLRESMRKYIEAALQMPDEFLAVQFNKAPAILEYTAFLFQGASAQKPALAILTQNLKDIFKDRDIDQDTIELTAQIIATATLGLAVKLIFERELSEEQRNKLIEHHVTCMVDGVIIGGIGR